jgi:hypothetical protein
MVKSDLMVNDRKLVTSAPPTSPVMPDGVAA